VLAALLEGAFRRRDADAWEATLTVAGVGCVRADGAEPGRFWQRDPHVRENGWVLPMRHSRFGTMLRHGPLWGLEKGKVVCGNATTAGDATDRVLAELGYSAADIAAMRKDGVVWSEAA
jgi:crotonobetainyl-CoA:carnitine CoA-transferase CaiB-like acyl-CoA transferase